MNVCLINPILPRDLKTFATTLPNIGLASLAASLKDGHTVRLIDTTFHPDYRRYIRERLAGFRPGVVGFSCTSFNFHGSLEIAAFLREIVPKEARFIWGGVHPTLLPDETLSEPLVDAVCIGEGELTAREYLDALERGSSPEGVAGVWYKASGKGVVRNPLCPFIADIDSLPLPDWEGFEMRRYIGSGYWGHMGFIASRGCPYHCTFCASPSIGRRIPGTYYRKRRPGLVAREIKLFRERYLKDVGSRIHVYFQDETFGIDKAHFESLCGLFRSDPGLADITWGCETRADLVTEEWAAAAAGAGCSLVKLGIESADESIRNLVYGKNIPTASIYRSIEILRSHGIGAIAILMLGSHRETARSVRANYAYIRAARPTYFFTLVYRPTPGTRLYEETLREQKADAGDTNNVPPPRVPPGLNLRPEAFRRLKLRLFLDNAIRLNKTLFLPRLLSALVVWLLTLRGERLNPQYFFTLLEKKLLFEQMQKKRAA